MRVLRYLFIAVTLLLAIALVTAYLQRERLALELANRMLAGSAFTVSDLSLSSLRTDGLYLARLEIRQDDGTRYVLHGVEIPLNLPDTRVRSASIGELSVAPGPSSGESLSVAALLGSIVDLPASFPEIDVRIGTIDYPGMPDIAGVHWQTRFDRQSVDARINGVALSVTSTATGAGAAAIDFSAGTDLAEIATAQLSLDPVGQGYVAIGRMDLDTAVLVSEMREESLLELAGTSVAGNLAGKLRIDVETESAGEYLAWIEPDTEQGLQLEWQGAEPDAIGAAIDDLRVRQMSLAYPALSWNFAADEFSARIAAPYWRSATVRVANLACTSADGCTADTELRAERVTFDGTSARRARIESGANLQIREPATLELLPRLATASELSGAGWAMTALKVDSAKNLRLAASTDTLTVVADRLQASIDGFAYGDELTATTRAALSDVQADLLTGDIRFEFGLPAVASSYRWDELQPASADARGSARIAGDRTEIDLALVNTGQGLDSAFEIRMGASETRIVVKKANLDFGKSPMSGLLMSWGRPWDIVDGTASAEGVVTLRGDGDTNATEGRLTVDFAGIAGNFNDLGATGASGSLPVELRSDFAAHLGPGDISVEFIDIGLPIRDLVARVEWDTASESVLVERLAMQMLGGKASAAPFRVHVDDLDSEIRLEVDGVQLALIAELAGLSDVEVTGSLKGMIPIKMENSEVTVRGGRLENLPPGGEIRYDAGVGAGDATGLGFASRALSNLQYESLTSGVDYAESGNLVLAMRLKGINPDLDPLQPVILNLNVENNIPQLLRSLQATRDIEEIIESRAR